MQKLNKKHQDILNAAKELFWKFGIKRVTIEEICKTGNVSKVTFYKYYSNKNDLAKFLMSRIVEEAVEQYDSIMASDIPYSEKTKELILLKMEGMDNVSKEFLADLYSTNDPELMGYMASLAKQSLERSVADYTEAQKNGDIRSDININFILYFLGHMQKMITDPNLIAMYDKPADMVSELINFFFYGILSREK